MLFTFDLETSVDCKEQGRMSASPHYSGNSIVLAGWKNNITSAYSYGTSSAELTSELNDFLEMGESVVLCGFNIGFDLAYLLRDEMFRSTVIKYMPQIRVWDVQQAQYLISGQQMKYPSLDECCALYGLPVKPDKIKEYWKNGVRTEDIPKDELAEYLEHDVSVTEQLALLQVKQMSKEMRELCFIKGDDILCTTIMENVGMHFDLGVCAKISDELRNDVLELHQKIVDLVKHESGYEYFTPTKLRDVQTVLYGGEFSWETKEPDGVYKTGMKKGQVKLKKVVHTIKFDGILSTKTQALAKEKFGTAVGDSVLQWIVENEHPENWAVGQFIGYMQNFREWHKDLSTYYDGYSALVWEDGMIRPNFQHCSTGTGRQSCTQPNLQNVSKGE